jgi:hypothetical protein
MAGLRVQGPNHRPLGVFDRASSIARQAEIDPGVGEAGTQLGGYGEGLFGSRGLARGQRAAAKAACESPRRNAALNSLNFANERGSVTLPSADENGGVASASARERTSATSLYST